MELFDEVDQQDNVIGKTTKEKSHANGRIHRVVAVFIFNKDGKLLVQKRKDDGTLDHSVGGHVRSAESYDSAAIRESAEELRVTYNPKLLSVFLSDERANGKNVIHMFGLYEHVVPDNWQFRPTEEVNEVIPMTIQEVCMSMKKDPRLFTVGFLNTMKEYLKVKTPSKS